MPYIRATIVRWAHDEQGGEPGYIEVQFEDRFGRLWSIIDKTVMFTGEWIRSSTRFPRPLGVPCMILYSAQDSEGRKVVVITTQEPWGIEATDGTDTFELFANQVTETDDYEPSITRAT